MKFLWFNFMISFKNKEYGFILIGSILYSTYIQIWKLSIEVDLLSFGLLILTLLSFYQLANFNKYSKVIIKVWSLIAFIAGSLGLVSIVLIYALNYLRGVFDWYPVFYHVLHATIGAIIYFKFESSVKQV